MRDIHPTAVVSPDAELGEGVRVLAYTIIEGNVTVGDRCTIGPFAVVRSGTRIGPDTSVHTGAVLGEPPQDLKYEGEPSLLVIGAHNQIREFVTLHRATGEGNATVIGDHNLLMAYSHIGHNCRIGSHCQFANYAGVSGHCTFEDYVIVGGMVGFHQYVTVGTMAMVAGMSRVLRDVPPYCLVEGNPARPRTINTRGLRRRGLTEEEINALHHAYRVIFRSELNLTQALDKLEMEGPLTAHVRHLIDFMRRVHRGVLGRQYCR